MNTNNEAIQLLGEALSDVLAIKHRVLALEFQIQKAITMLQPTVVIEPASKLEDSSIVAEDRNPNLEMGY